MTGISWSARRSAVRRRSPKRLALLLKNAKLDSEPYKALRARGVQCFGIGAAIDVEHGPKGYGMHSDHERLLESELYRFVRYNYEVVVDLARSR